MSCGYKHPNIGPQLKFKQGMVYIIYIEGFWSFVNEWLIKHQKSQRGSSFTASEIRDDI